MTEIQKSLIILEQLEKLLGVVEPHERPEIEKIIERRRFKLGLQRLQAELESILDGSFDPSIPRKLDAIQVLLEGE